MSSRPLASLDYPDSELVFGVVSPTGSNIDALAKSLAEYLEAFSYKLEQVTYATWDKQRRPFVDKPFVRQTERWDDFAIPIWPDVTSVVWSGLKPLSDGLFDEFGERWKHAEVRRQRAEPRG